jgi:hypothetical protein
MPHATITTRPSDQAAVHIAPWGHNDDRAVDAFVSGHEAGLIYYTSTFRRFLVNMLGCVCVSRLAWRGDQLTGVLPIQRREGPDGAVLNSLPFFGSYGGVLAGDDESAAALHAEYENLSQGIGVVASTWISNPFAAPAQPPVHHFTDERIAQWTTLSGADDVLQRIDSSARRNAQKARNEGVSVYESADALGFLEQVHRENMAAIGGRQKPAEFFTALASMKYGQDWRLYVAERARERVAALLTFEAARTVEYVMPVVREAARSIQPTAAILSYAMPDAARRGMESWNWGGTWLTQDGVYRFKKKWGAQERRYRYFITLNDSRLRQRTPAELSERYPWFYTLPFGILKPSGAS